MKRAFLYLFFLTMGFQLIAVSCRAQVVQGCTDPKANNFDSGATENDGSCTYDPISISSVSTFPLDDQLKETSGLILWDGLVWTHNDNTDLYLYGLDTLNLEIDRIYQLEDVENISWEEVAQDKDYIYLGDFGNNTSGSRTDLHILRVAKSSLESGIFIIDTIWFSYADQLDLTPAEPNQTDFDCEAFVVSDDSIYLFTKQWISAGTSVYRIPKIPGTYKATNITTFDIHGLVTGVTWMPTKSLLVLCGYTSLLDPFLYLLYDFHGMDFFSGNKRKVGLSLPFHQVEGIATLDGMKYYVSNEAFKLEPVIYTPQKLHVFDLQDLLHEYLTVSAHTPVDLNDGIAIYPNPAGDFIQVRTSLSSIKSDFRIFDSASRMIMQGVLVSGANTIHLSHLQSGTFTLIIEGSNTRSTFFVKR